MPSPSDFGRILLIAGGVLLLLGLALTFAGRLPWLGRLPGDIVYRRGEFTLYLPFATCALLSLILTALFSLLRR